jgi:hypothetical protein
MDNVLTALKDTPIPTILVLAGITFLLLAIVSQLVGRIILAPERKRWAVIIGGGLLAIGLTLHVVPLLAPYPDSYPRQPSGQYPDPPIRHRPQGPPICHRPQSLPIRHRR